MTENDLIENEPTKVYIKTDSNNNITAVNSDIFLSDLTGWIYIDEGHGDKYSHAQGHYLDKPIMTDKGIYRYKYIDNAVAEKTEEEIAEEIEQLPKPEPTANEKIEALTTAVSSMLGTELTDNIVPLQYNRFLQMQVQAANLTDTQAMEVADLYPDWQTNTKYVVDTILKYGKNSDNETQLYRVIQEHISQDDWRPNIITTSLYKAIGFETDGTPIWTQPLGAHDAYNKNDVVFHNNKKWVSAIDNNVWEPGVYGWNVVEESD